MNTKINKISIMAATARVMGKAGERRVIPGKFCIAVFTANKRYTLAEFAETGFGSDMHKPNFSGAELKFVRGKCNTYGRAECIVKAAELAEGLSVKLAETCSKDLEFSKAVWASAKAAKKNAAKKTAAANEAPAPVAAAPNGRELKAGPAFPESPVADAAVAKAIAAAAAEKAA